MSDTYSSIDNSSTTKRSLAASWWSQSRTWSGAAPLFAFVVVVIFTALARTLLSQRLLSLCCCSNSAVWCCSCVRALWYTGMITIQRNSLECILTFGVQVLSRMNPDLTMPPSSHGCRIDALNMYWMRRHFYFERYFSIWVGWVVAETGLMWFICNLNIECPILNFSNYFDIYLPFHLPYNIMSYHGSRKRKWDEWTIIQLQDHLQLMALRWCELSDDDYHVAVALSDVCSRVCLTPTLLPS
jgi:hypothetical protein